MQSSNSVIIKGVREGLLFILDDDVPFPMVLTELTERISVKPDFFRGAEVTINAGNRVMDRPDFDVVYKMLTRNGMRVHTFVSLSAQSRMVAEGFGVASRPPAFAAPNAGGSARPQAMTLGTQDVKAGAASLPGLHWAQPGNLPSQAANVPTPEAKEGIFVRRNLRPGESLRYGGDVCVIGDVEVGSEIVAGGDIVVWGALSGIAHAGANGDGAAVVCALGMSPTQLSIADYVISFPKNEALYSAGLEWGGAGAHTPMLARIESGRIAVEAWSVGGYVDQP